LRAAGG
jgi:hypothetical protein